MPRKRRAGPVDDKVLDRTIKLLRLAAPSSGSTEHERASAALEAAKLIDEHEITIGGVTIDHVRDASSGSGKKTVSPHAWVLNVAIDHCSCSICYGPISPRDVVWIRSTADRRLEFRHNYGKCAVC